MNFVDFKQQFGEFIVFSLVDIQKIEPGFDRRRLSEWQKRGYLSKVRRGYYIFADTKITEEILFLVANVIYRPSYVSFEMALSHYSFIPESAQEITSATTRERARFSSTTAGRFSYRALHPRMFFGYELHPVGARSYQIASPEKAVLDYLYVHARLRDEDDFESVRFDTQGMRERINWETFAKYRDIFQVKALSRRADALKEYIFSHD